MKHFNKSMMEEFYDWEIAGINIGDAIRKQMIPEYIPKYEADDGVDEDGKTIYITKTGCPDCGEYFLREKWCQHCGRRLRE